MMISAAELAGEEQAEWYSLTPMERWRESAKLWEVFLSLGARLIPDPIHKVLSSIETHRFPALLMMGGQACVLFGAAEFSRDIDFGIYPDSRRLSY